MIFKQHSPELSGRHAFLSPSQNAWLNYDEQKMEARFFNHRSAQRGTDIHAHAHESIRLGIRLDPQHAALATYVNDALEFGMVCEQMLYYSENCFGTADTIGFHGGILRIHDLKNGLISSGEKQLYVYTAIFCLEYGISPFEIDWELRVYQRDEIRVYRPEPELILRIMDKIIFADRQIEELKEVHYR